jgi:di/tricarboxylate transporter
MNTEILILSGIILFSIAAFVREWLPMDVVALSCLALLLVFDLVTPEQAIQGFSNPAVITVMMMFVLSAGLVQSGLVSKLGYRISDIGGDSRWKPAVLLLLLTGVISAFLNNTAAVAVFMPVAIHIARHHDFSPSKLLMPLSYTAIFGGTCTLLGTSTNLLVDSLAVREGAGSFTMFEFLKLGGIFFAVGILYNVLVPMRFMPSRAVTTSSLTRQYHLSGFLTELRVPAGSKLIGSNVVDEQVSERFQMNVLEIVRQKHKIFQDIRNTAIEEGDILLVRGAMEDILAFKERYGLLLLTDIKLSDDDFSDSQTVLAEVQLSPSARFIGSTLKEIDFRRQYGCFVLALNRTGEYIRDKLAAIPLRQWDTLLVFGSRPRVEALYEQRDFLALGERELSIRLERRWWISALIIVAVVLLAALGVMPILKAAILGGVLLLVTRRLTIQQAYRAIDWSVIFLIAAILPMGQAMENTGLAELIAGAIQPVGAEYGPRVLLSLLFIATTLLTSIFSNNATAVLMVPIAVTAARELGLDTKPFLMAVAYAASLSFITPVGYQTNAMVFGPGNYKFMDFMRFGWPLTLLYWGLATLLIPVFWPL